MKHPITKPSVLSFIVALSIMTSVARGQITLSGADGSDGFFLPSQSVTIDLGQAVSAPWDTESPTPGLGVYDAEKWALVFKLEGVDIPGDVTIDFKNHPSHAPIVWLVDGDVKIDGTIQLNGKSGGQSVHAEGGPGGFRAGIGRENAQKLGSAGFGPGGGLHGDFGGAGSYGSKGLGSGGDSGSVYGNAQILPLIGGSGGSGRAVHDGVLSHQGGGGGGAILIAATGKIIINGIIQANSGHGNISGTGSGGAIRLIADQIGGTGKIEAKSGTTTHGILGGNGRIRLEANSFEGGLDVFPEASIVAPDTPALLWSPSTAPTVTIAAIDGVEVPDDPRANINLSADVTIEGIGTVDVDIETTNIPANATVKLRVVPKFGGSSFTKDARFLSEDEGISLWRATVDLSNGFAVMQVRAVVP